MTIRDVVFPSGRQALYERNRYSPAIRSNGFLFISGQVGSREDGSPEPGLEAQVRRAFTNLNAILAAADARFEAPYHRASLLATGILPIASKLAPTRHTQTAQGACSAINSITQSTNTRSLRLM